MTGAGISTGDPENVWSLCLLSACVRPPATIN